MALSWIDHTQQGHERFLHFATPSGGGTPTNTPTPPAIDNSVWVGSSPLQTVQPNQSFAVQFTFQNDGTTTWSDPVYALACDLYYHPSNNACMGGQPVGFGGQQVGPGQQFTFTVNLVAPGAAGTYQTWWDITDNGAIFGNNNNYVTVIVQNSPQPTATPTATPPPTYTPTATPTPPPTYTPTATPVPPWYAYFAQHRPFCDDGSACNGNVNGSATDDCSFSNGLVLSQYGHAYAELDLDRPNGNQNYSQTAFRETVQVGFLNPSDTSVWAALLVQTPQNPSQHGGYLLAINSSGTCQIQQANSDGSITENQPCGQMSINPGSFTMQVVVLNGQLTAYINGQQVAQIGDNLNPQPGAVSLMEESGVPTSSAILWSNFELDLHT